MIIAHLPSGYIAYRASGHRSRFVFWGCLLGAIFPDFDLIWFYFVDGRAVHHHRYWVHIPGVWLASTLVALPVLWRMKPAFRHAGIAFLTLWFIHLCLDSIVGSIMWLWPISDQFFQLATVQPTHSRFILSFMAHWSFALEIALWITAIVLFLKRPRIEH
ncbi:metal-dependent hydrolase [Litoreibacter sp.]|nr:metal-dependent hydrolase [Litoreibacter sp.]